MKINKEQLQIQMARASLRHRLSIRQVIELAKINYAHYYNSSKKWEMWIKTLVKLEKIGFDIDRIVIK